jgi:hypothetical protein
MKNIHKTDTFLSKHFLLSALLIFCIAAFASAQNDVVTLIYDNTRLRDLTFTADGKFLIGKSGDDVVTNSKGIVTSPCVHVWDLETNAIPPVLLKKIWVVPHVFLMMAI